ncbi:PIN domain-containing protein [Aquifex sp.]
MIPKYILDTSFIIALLFEKDYYHEEAKRIYKHLPDNAEFITHQLVIAEASSVACRRCRERKLDCNFVLEKLSELFGRIDITTKAYPYEKILEDMKQFNCSLSFVDTVLLKEAKRLKANILTFDSRLEQLSKGIF